MVFSIIWRTLLKQDDNNDDHDDDHDDDYNNNNDDDEGWGDDNSGYHSDKYDDVEDFPFELDNENLKRVTGLKKLVWEKDTNSEEE